MINTNSLFLAQSYKDAWEDYKRSLNHEGFVCWDYCIITASNERQAEGFRAQIEERKRKNMLPLSTHFAVIPDKDGKRIGSGGATLGVIKYIAEHIGGSDFSGKRILVIHSGGDSKRVPQYSALGKLFSPVPHETENGQSSTLFDELIISVSTVPSRIREGMLLLSGDALLLFNPLQIDFSGRDAAAVSFKEHVDIAKNHGVFLRGEDGYVKKFLHKQTVEVLTECKAVNEFGCVDIDTGAVIFSSDIISVLYGLISENGKISSEKYDKYVNETVRLSLYGDFLYPLAQDSTLERFYSEKPEGEYCEELKSARREIWELLSCFKMKLLRLAPAKFIHFGTTYEILRLMSNGTEEYAELGWKRCVNSSVKGNVAGYNSVLEDSAAVGENSYLEVSYVHNGSHVGSNTVLSYIDVNNRNIPSDVVLHGLKQKDGKFVVRIYGVRDNPKGDADSPFLGTTLREFIAKNAVDESDIWKTDKHDIWNADIYPVCETVGEALDAALNVYALANGGGNVGIWLNAERKSLCSGFNDADPKAIILWNNRMDEIVRMDGIIKLINERRPVEDAKKLLSYEKLTGIQEQWIEKNTKNAGFGKSMRIYYYIGTALGGSEGDKYIAKCFKSIHEAILEGAVSDLQVNNKCRIMADRCSVELPLRVNWGGGWSDTPPYCNENGGTVINAAILLNGMKPVRVCIEKIKEKKIVFDSRDMDVHGEFDKIELLQNTGDPYDPFALQKAALLSCGIIPFEGGDLNEILERIGGGFLMRSEVTGVPKGSGLGTSSILSAACVKALNGFFGIGYNDDEVYEKVLCMEQIMSTGGGWQDQVGGASGGIKFITSRPGTKQDLKVKHINISDSMKSELDERFMLIYTGQRRLARNILRDVVGKYVGNDPETLYALNEIQRVAALMRFELERGRLDEFAKLMSYHWDLSKKIDSGSTNTLIEQIFASVDDLTDGKMICGAGGGGFLQVIAKKGVDKEKVHLRLKQVFQDFDIDVWNSQFVWETGGGQDV